MSIRQNSSASLGDACLQADEPAHDLNDLLEAQRQQILRDCGAEAVAVLCDELRARRSRVSNEVWNGAVIPACRRHAIHQLLLEDPYTRRAFEKPRGYAGDAEMLDYVYTGVPPRDTSEIGRAVFRGTTGLPNGQSVVARRNLLAERIDEVADSRPQARILSLACGHLRESQCSRAVAGGRIGEFFALDQDTESLQVVRREQSLTGVQTVQGSVGAIIRKRLAFTDLDFVYAAGLFDYLSDEFSKRLLALMVEMLRPGGRLLVANFTPHNHGRGYMECFMDWRLVYRDEEQLESLLEEVALTLIAEKTVYRDDGKNVVYLDLIKA